MQYLTNRSSWITLKLTFSQQFSCQLIVEMLQPDGEPHWSTESIWSYQEKALCAFSDSTTKVEVRKAKKRLITCWAVSHLLMSFLESKCL